MNKEELDLLESVFTLAIGECAYNDINNIQKLEYKIKTINNLCKKQKEVIDKAIDFINNNGEKQYNHHDNYRGKWYSPDELDTLEDILKEVE